jgi:hypothetical protein
MGVPWLRSGPSPPVISAMVAASSLTWGRGWESIRFDRSAAGGSFESEYVRSCGDDIRTTGRSHCACGLGRRGMARAKLHIFKGGGMADVVVLQFGRLTMVQSHPNVVSRLVLALQVTCLIRSPQARCPDDGETLNSWNLFCG